MNEISAQTRDLVRKQQYAYAVKKNGEKGSEGASVKGGEASKTQPNPQRGLSTIDKEWKKVDFKRKVCVAPLTTVGNLPFSTNCERVWRRSLHVAKWHYHYRFGKAKIRSGLC